MGGRAVGGGGRFWTTGGETLPQGAVAQRLDQPVGEVLAAADSEVQAVPPCRTSSALLPMSLQITGRRWWKASWIATGVFSHQIDGITTQSTCAINRGSLSDR